MPKYLIRVDAINLYANAVGDCQQLSVLRGGGLMLLNAIKAMAEKEHEVWRGSQFDRTVSKGASSLLCEVSTADPAKLRQTIEDHLSTSGTGLPVDQTTFAVSVAPYKPEEFRQACEAGVAANRWKQMQSASVVYPRQGATRVCDVDLVRPATEPFRDAGERVSESVKRRFDYGREQKQNFYQELTGIKGLKFVTDLEDLCEDSAEDFGNLGRKYALIHVDGNDFGAIQRGCKTADDLLAWDKLIQGKRRAALTEVLRRIQKRGAKSEWMNGDQVRIETLLWGGDETIWAVPAWCGWTFLETWFDLCRGWTFNGTPLTHAAGIVFCHEKAPIHRVRELAIDLTEATKTGDRTVDRLSYLVLESFDQIGRDMDVYRESIAKHFGGTANWNVDAIEMPALRKGFAALRQNRFPRSKVADMARAIADGNATGAARLRERLELTSTAKAAFEALEAQWSGMICLHLAELWDYLVDAKELAA